MQETPPDDDELAEELVEMMCATPDSVQRRVHGKSPAHYGNKRALENGDFQGVH